MLAVLQIICELTKYDIEVQRKGIYEVWLLLFFLREIIKVC